MATSLLVISDREPLAWMLRTSSFAIPVGRASSAPRVGDSLLLYTTRGCYRNPTRDLGLVMGAAHVVAEATCPPRGRGPTGCGEPSSGCQTGMRR